MNSSRHIRRERLAYGIAGFIVGSGVAVLVRWLVGGGFAAFEAIAAGVLGSSVGLRLGQRFRMLPTADELGLVRLREEMSPLDLAPGQSVPKTLLTRTEKRSKL